MKKLQCLILTALVAIAFPAYCKMSEAHKTECLNPTVNKVEIVPDKNNGGRDLHPWLEYQLVSCKENMSVRTLYVTENFYINFMSIFQPKLWPKFSYLLLIDGKKAAIGETTEVEKVGYGLIVRTAITLAKPVMLTAGKPVLVQLASYPRIYADLGENNYGSFFATLFPGREVTQGVVELLATDDGDPEFFSTKRLSQQPERRSHMPVLYSSPRVGI